MICPDCGEECVKMAIEQSDCSGWLVAWVCECDVHDDNIQMYSWSKDDWTANIVVPLLEE